MPDQPVVPDAFRPLPDTAVATLAISLGLTVVLGAKLFGLF